MLLLLIIDSLWIYLQEWGLIMSITMEVCISECMANTRKLLRVLVIHVSSLHHYYTE